MIGCKTAHLVHIVQVFHIGHIVHIFHMNKRQGPTEERCHQSWRRTSARAAGEASAAGAGDVAPQIDLN